MKIKILGTGGAFDINEGNSSFLIEMDGENYLVDCGFTVFPELIRQKLVDKIDYVCITHNDFDHIGSLSTLIYYNYFILKKKTKIISSYSVAHDLSRILSTIRHINDQVEFANVGKVDTIPTDGKHIECLPSGALCFGNKLIISGDLGCPLFDVKVLTGGLTVFHDASTFESPVHCFYKKLDNQNKNLYLYHHSAAARAQMEQDGYKCLIVGQEMEI